MLVESHYAVLTPPLFLSARHIASCNTLDTFSTSHSPWISDDDFLGGSESCPQNTRETRNAVNIMSSGEVKKLVQYALSFPKQHQPRASRNSIYTATNTSTSTTASYCCFSTSKRIPNIPTARNSTKEDFS